MARALTASPLRSALDALLRPYAQIVFATDLRAGLLVLLAIASFPMLALATLGAVAIADVVVLLFGLGRAAVRQGGYACTAVLATLAIGVFAPAGGPAVAHVVMAAVLAVLFMASFEAVFAPVALPTHSLPFIAAAWTVHLASHSLPAVAAESLVTPLSLLPHGLLESSWLDIPASLLFLHGEVAGILVIAAIALYSRIALLLAVVGGLVAALMRLWLRADMPWSLVDVVASFNGILAAMAVGGIWFVPQPSSIALGAGAAAVATVLAYALSPAASIAYLPVLSLPFIVTTHLLLTAARRRETDAHPRSAVPADRPEEALAKHLARVRRFGNVAWLPFRLPFRGEWTVTQAYDGRYTHKGPWRHALDFEILGPDGEKYRNEGSALGDYHCYGLPVVAAGEGTVVKVVDGIADNRPGEVNTRDNWGNAVVIAHGLALHSVYAHLKPGSIRVKQGEVVSPGTEIARSGSSGRSPVPHLHFQVQRAPALGSPTLAADFGDVVTRSDDGATLASRVTPGENDVVRPVTRDEAVARALSFDPGTAWELVDSGSGRRERAQVEVDLLGRRFLESDRARLFIDVYDGGFVVVDFEGDPRSLLRFVLYALARVPFDQAERLSWTENLPRRLLLPGLLRAAADLVALVAPEAGGTLVRYASRRSAGALEVIGESPRFSSRAELSLGGGAHRIEVRRDGTSQSVEVCSIDPDQEQAA